MLGKGVVSEWVGERRSNWKKSSVEILRLRSTPKRLLVSRANRIEPNLDLNRNNSERN